MDGGAQRANGSPSAGRERERELEGGWVGGCPRSLPAISHQNQKERSVAGEEVAEQEFKVGFKKIIKSTQQK